MTNPNRRQFIRYGFVAVGTGVLAVLGNQNSAASTSGHEPGTAISKIVLKKVMLVGNWPSDTELDIRFIDKKIGSPLLIDQTSKWVDYPADTALNLTAPGNLWQYWDGAFFSMCTQPILDVNLPQKDADAVIKTPLGEVHVRYDIIA
ncbi:hypothetical protein [Adonisia turfae]|nr:hypothetical protein [Adonisia turfae]